MIAPDDLKKSLKELELKTLDLEDLQKSLKRNQPEIARAGQLLLELKATGKPPVTDHKSSNKSVSVQVSDGKFTANQKEDGVSIRVTGKVEGSKVAVDDIQIADGSSRATYKRIADVPEKYRGAVKGLIANTDKSPVRFQFNKQDR